MTEITCSKAKTCARLNRLGTHACSNCSSKPTDTPTGTCSNEGTTDDETQADSEELEHDDYGNEGSHLFRVRLSRTVYESAYVDIAADDEEDAIDRAELVDGIEWEHDDSEYDSTTIDQTLS